MRARSCQADHKNEMARWQVGVPHFGNVLVLLEKLPCAVLARLFNAHKQINLVAPRQHLGGT